jgi:methionyl-tRNA formyltransferase
MKIGILTQKKYSAIRAAFLQELREMGHDIQYLEDHSLVNPSYDLVVSLLYNRIIKNNEFDIPRLGTINIHPSLLPHHRGSFPNFWAVLTGEGSGWTAHRMTAKIDRGDIYLQHPVPVRLSDTAETLQQRLFDELPTFLHNVAELISEGDFTPIDIEQNIDVVHTLKEFRGAHDLGTTLNEMFKDDERTAYSAMLVLELIKACSYEGYEAAYLDMDDGRVEFRAKVIK